MLCTGQVPECGIIIGKETEMAKKKGNAGSKKTAAKVSSRTTAKAKKNRAAKDAAAVKAVLDAEAVREAAEKLVRLEKGEADEKAAAPAEVVQQGENVSDDNAQEVDEGDKSAKRKPRRQKGDATPKAEQQM
jgi:hypothetical protein